MSQRQSGDSRAYKILDLGCYQVDDISGIEMDEIAEYSFSPASIKVGRVLEINFTKVAHYQILLVHEPNTAVNNNATGKIYVKRL